MVRSKFLVRHETNAARIVANREALLRWRDIFSPSGMKTPGTIIAVRTAGGTYFKV
jgi:hypothetical protein